MIGKRLGALVGAVVMIVLVGPGNANAAIYDVDSTPDVTHAGGCTAAPDDCSLRDAVIAASGSADAENRINLPAGTYPVTAGQLPMGGATAVELVGAGTRSTVIQGDGLTRVLDVTVPTGTISDLTIQGGFAEFDPGMIGVEFTGDGGGILATGETLNLARVAITGNTASLNGAGVSAPPENAAVTKITITDSTIANNTVTGGAIEGLGGGIYVFGDLSITNSTITGNTITNPGISQGAGVASAIDPAETDGTTLTLINTTIVGNTVPPTGTGAGLAIENPVPATATTGVTATNTIIAGNLAGEGSNDCLLVTVPTSDNNLSSDSSCQFTDDGSFQGTDAGIGPLSDNGGPTDTIPLNFDSPAYNGGTETGCPATDQRGTTRPQGPACDIGAFELVPAPEPPPPPPPGAKSADLSAKLSANPDRPELGQKVKFSFEVSNAGPDPATETVVTGKLPGRAKKVKPQEGCKVAKRGKKYRLRCELGTLANGSSREFSVKVKPKKGVRKPRATLQVKSAVTDPNGANNKVKKKVTVEKE